MRLRFCLYAFLMGWDLWGTIEELQCNVGDHPRTKGTKTSNITGSGWSCIILWCPWLSDDNKKMETAVCG